MVKSIRATELDLGNKKHRLAIQKTIVKARKIIKGKRRYGRDQRKKADEIARILGLLPKNDSGFDQLTLTRLLRTQICSMIEDVDKFSDDSGEDEGPVIRDSAPRLPKTLKIGTRKIFGGERKEVGWLPNTRKSVMNKNRDKNKGPLKGKLVCMLQRKSDCKVVIDEKDVEIDHIVEWSKRQFDSDAVRFCYDGWHFDGVYVDDLIDVYNDEGNLQVSCKRCNPSKSGKKGFDLNGPTSVAACQHGGGKECKLPKAK